LNTPSLSTVYYRKQCDRSLATISVRGQDCRIVVYDHATNRAVFDVEPTVCCSCADLSTDGRHVAIGYWDRSDIDVWDLVTNHHRTVKSPSQVSRVLFDQTADWLVFQSERGTYAVHIAETARTKILHAEDLHDAAFRLRDNVMLIPLRRKGQVAVVRFDPVLIETVTLPIDSVIRCMRHSPADDSLFLIDGTGCVYTYDDELRQVGWRTQVEERPFTGAYCGDGSLIGLHATQLAGPPRVVVLNAQSGTRIAKHAGRGCVGDPLAGDSVLLRGVYAGQFLHLRDGSIDSGVAPRFGVEYNRPRASVT
jgi:hypothetical protein